MIKLSTVKLMLSSFFLFCQTIATSQPVASFFVDRHNICSGQIVNFNNTSSSSNMHQWLIDGVHYSFSLDTLAVLYEDCYDLKEIMLIAGDSTTGLSDSASIVVSVFDTCYFHWTGTFLNCPGDTIQLSASTEAIATEFFISEPVTILNGCLVCLSIEFILQNQGTYVDKTSTYQGGCHDVTSYEYVCSTTNIIEYHKCNAEIYPNPVRENFLVTAKENGPLRLEVSTLTGKILVDQILFEQITQINFTNYPPGVYICKLSVKNKIPFIKKIIKH